MAVVMRSDVKLDMVAADEKNMLCETVWGCRISIAAVAANAGRVEDLGDVDVPFTRRARRLRAGEPKNAVGDVMSYSLAGRRARSLPMPAYKCEQGGVVVVDIGVNGAGRVAN